MNSLLAALLLLILNLGLLWLLMAAPVGRRRITVTKHLPVGLDRVWSALIPGPGEAGWSGRLKSIQPLESQRYRYLYDWPDRKGEPISRIIATEDFPVVEGRGLTLRVTEDSALDGAFWRDYLETRQARRSAEGTEVTFSETDTYRGLAMLIFRWIRLRREARNFESWLTTGEKAGGGWLEHPATQVVFASLSILALWPFFGLRPGGLILSTLLTTVIVLHEFGHLAAYWAFGHRQTRIIIIPLLGGMAIGGRPYDSRFEVAACAMMGAGLSALPIPALVTLHAHMATNIGETETTNYLVIFLLLLGGFNLLNLLPMNRFDGGQVLQQVFGHGHSLMTASLSVTFIILSVGWTIGVPSMMLVSALAVFTILSLIGAARPKPRLALTKMESSEKVMVLLGLFAALGLHGYAIIYSVGVLWA